MTTRSGGASSGAGGASGRGGTANAAAGTTGSGAGAARVAFSTAIGAGAQEPRVGDYAVGANARFGIPDRVMTEHGTWRLATEAEQMDAALRYARNSAPGENEPPILTQARELIGQGPNGALRQIQRGGTGRAELPLGESPRYASMRMRYLRNEYNKANAIIRGQQADGNRIMRDRNISVKQRDAALRRLDTRVNRAYKDREWANQQLLWHSAVYRMQGWHLQRGGEGILASNERAYTAPRRARVNAESLPGMRPVQLPPGEASPTELLRPAYNRPGKAV